MTNWQDKYKDIEVGQSAWYWHKEKNESWKILEVRCMASTPNGDKIIRHSTRPYYGCLISEDYPNGPRCMTPDEIGKNEEMRKLRMRTEQELRDGILDTFKTLLLSRKNFPGMSIDRVFSDRGFEEVMEEFEYLKSLWATSCVKNKPTPTPNSNILLEALEDLAEGDCHYGDGCPTFGSRHGTCTSCKARKAIEKYEGVRK
jgi:hypothetical protein